MNLILYIIIFIMGSVFGSFLTLATYRIPLNEDITHKHSYCPKCNHKLGFLDMIPILSYVFLKGKCRYCKSKISPRYFIIELLCGISFVLLALALEVNIYTININTICNFILGSLYIVFLFLVAGIDKEHHYIDKRVLVYGIIVNYIYIIYEYFYNESFNVNRIIIYFIIIMIVLIINTYEIKKKGKDSYAINIILLCFIIALFTYETVTIFSVIMTMFIIAFREIINSIIKNKHKNENINLPIAFYICIANCITILLTNIILI